MSEFIDISLDVSHDLPNWPGNPEILLNRRLDLGRGDPCNDTTMHFSVHTGTHVDAPLHFLTGGADISQLSLDILAGSAFVAWLPADVLTVTANDLEGLLLPLYAERLLLRTRNSGEWAAGRREFNADFVALTPGAARWVVERGIRLIGIDYLSIQRFRDEPLVHHILLNAGVVIVEGLNLANVQPGEYDLICLPLRLVNVEGAPARAVLRREKL